MRFSALKWLLPPTLALSVGLISFGPTGAHAAEDIAGIWLGDQGDGDMEIKPCGQAMCGFIISILDPKLPPNPHDIYNQRKELQTRPICGLQLLGDLKQDGDAWEGWGYDPHPGRGQTYQVEVKLQDANTLMVHGYLGIKLFGETKLLTRDSKNIHRCSRPPG